MKTTSGQDALTTRPVAEVLRKSLERLGPNGENWAHPFGKSRGCCAWTACGDMESAMLLAETGGFTSSKELFKWNDAPERTFAEVKALFEKAIAKAGGQ